MKQAEIIGIASYLPEKILSNQEIARSRPDWDMVRIEEKTGIRQRHIAAPTECASDMAVKAASTLLSRPGYDRSAVDYLLFCTQTPDYFLPTTACILQSRLGLATSIGALDYNLGCSGYVYGLSLAKGLIDSGQAENVLLVTADTYSKLIDVNDRNLLSIFGDAATATWVAGVESVSHSIGPFVFGTDGTGADNLIVRAGGMRDHDRESINSSPKYKLHMNGIEIFNFTLRVIPDCVKRLLRAANVSMDVIDWFVFHQANKYMLEHIQRKLGVPDEKFVLHLSDCGNTVSSLIPVAIEHLIANGKLKNGQIIMLLGFGVGYSWSAALIKWSGK